MGLSRCWVMFSGWCCSCAPSHCYCDGIGLVYIVGSSGQLYIHFCMRVARTKHPFLSLSLLRSSTYSFPSAILWTVHPHAESKHCQLHQLNSYGHQEHILSFCQVHLLKEETVLP